MGQTVGKPVDMFVKAPTKEDAEKIVKNFEPFRCPDRVDQWCGTEPGPWSNPQRNPWAGPFGPWAPKPFSEPKVCDIPPPGFSGVKNN